MQNNDQVLAVRHEDATTAGCCRGTISAARRRPTGP